MKIWHWIVNPKKNSHILTIVLVYAYFFYLKLAQIAKLLVLGWSWSRYNFTLSNLYKFACLFWQ